LTIDFNQYVYLILICYLSYFVEFGSWYYWICRHNNEYEAILLNVLPTIIVRLFIYSYVYTRMMLCIDPQFLKTFLVVLAIIIQSLLIPPIYKVLWKRIHMSVAYIFLVLLTVFIYWMLIEGEYLGYCN